MESVLFPSFYRSSYSSSQTQQAQPEDDANEFDGVDNVIGDYGNDANADDDDEYCH